MKLYLQNIAENFNLNNLPSDWLALDFERFSNYKSLFDYQQNALKNTLKILFLFYQEDKGDKSKFYQRLINNGLIENLDYNVIKEGKIYRYLSDYEKDFPVQNGKISFEHFINRMSFWMATGSGKTLVIVKLIELLGYLIANNNIPQKDILFLTYREDLIEQFKKHISEFNQFNPVKIHLYELKEFPSRKQNPVLSFDKSINVFFYRSDLISDEQKDKIVNYKNYDANGNWYILLDEAHKGDREESRRQIFYSILGRNGFLFNFSATFTDERDYATCVFNFNLARFIEDGYGKHIYISRENINALENKDNLIETEKQKILLKILILKTALNIQFENIRQIKSDLYHKPLLLTLVNSVNTEDSDLELFFREIEKIANGKGNNEILEIAKEEIIKELASENSKYFFEDVQIDPKIIDIIKNVSYENILKYVFNSETNGKVEIIKIPSNKQELIFKLTTSSIPFALMKIGDISEWIKSKLSGYEIIERFEDESIFQNLNNNEDINILMGSRSFYEGWDSNRPNIILFINIGKGIDARKFVLQSVGRGVRIEPLPNKRKRAIFLYNNKELETTLFEKINDKVGSLESLFVFGTKAENLKEVFETLKQEKPEVLLGDLFEINPDIQDKLLLIPTYRQSIKIIVDEQNVLKFPIHPDDFNDVREYFNSVGDKILLCKYDCDLRVLQKLHEGFNGKSSEYFSIDTEKIKISNPEFLLGSIFKHFANYTSEFNSFKKLEEEIIHFKRINISPDKLNSLRDKIEQIKSSKNKEALEKELDDKFDKGEISRDEYKKKIKEIESSYVKEDRISYSANEAIKIKYLANHYYIPVALTETEKSDFIQHIIKHKSEIKFINDLESYLQKPDNLFKQFDWWFFSKIDETLDDVYIPYYNPKTNRIDKFKPDFIFWLKKENNYFILFIDPKGTEHTDAYRKIEGYSRLFEIASKGNQRAKIFDYNEMKIFVKLFLIPSISDKSFVLKISSEYWLESIDSILKNLLDELHPSKVS